MFLPLGKALTVVNVAFCLQLFNPLCWWNFESQKFTVQRKLIFRGSGLQILILGLVHLCMIKMIWISHHVDGWIYEIWHDFSIGSSYPKQVSRDYSMSQVPLMVFWVYRFDFVLFCFVSKNNCLPFNLSPAIIFISIASLQFSLRHWKIYILIRAERGISYHIDSSMHSLSVAIQIYYC